EQDSLRQLALHGERPALVIGVQRFLVEIADSAPQKRSEAAGRAKRGLDTVRERVLQRSDVALSVVQGGYQVRRLIESALIDVVAIHPHHVVENAISAPNHGSRV